MSGLRECECGWAFNSVQQDDKWHRARCGSPTCLASTIWCHSRSEAIAAWNRRAPGVTVTREEIARAIYEAIVPPESDAMPFVRMNGALSDVDIDGSFDLLDAADAILSLLRSKT